MHLHIPRAHLPLNNWAGGTTSQCYIYPENSSYEKRDFLFRISTATVSSDGPFTKLEGVSRVLAVLKGAVSLRHDTQPSELLLDKNTLPYIFDGGADTVGKVLDGPVQDFNLMMRKGVTGKLQKYTCSNKQSLPLPRHADVLSCYPYDGCMTVEIGKESIHLAEGDFLIFFSEGTEIEISISSMTECKLITAIITL